MPRVIRQPASSSSWWPPLIAGAVLGALAGWLVLRTRDDEGGSWDRVGRRKHPPIDAEAMTARLREHAGAEQLRVRSLGQGILELVGTAADGADVPGLLNLLAGEPGVSVVVNRVWTPGSIGAIPHPGAVPMAGPTGAPDDPVKPAPAGS